MKEIVVIFIVGVIFFILWQKEKNKEIIRNKEREKEEIERKRIEVARKEKERIEKIKKEEEEREREKKEIKIANSLQYSLENKIKSFLLEISELKKNYIRNSNIKKLEKKYSEVFLDLVKIKKKYLFDFSKSFFNEWNYLKEGFDNYNRIYIENELKKSDSLLSNIDGKSLDSQQRLAVVTDEDNQLVVAGAGSGKTLTIAAKVAYLVSKKNINPKDILLITFTKKASDEMRDRIANRLKIPVEVSTFHSFGLKCIIKNSGQNPLIEDNLDKIVERYFMGEITKNFIIPKKLLEFFGVYLYSPQNLNKFETLGEYYESNKHIKFKTMKGILEDKVEWNEKGVNTYKGESVNSLEELLIANFLFVNGIEYEHKKLYPYDTHSHTYSHYKPDFYIKDYDIYLENFSIEKNGNPHNLFKPIESTRYSNDVRWKRRVHIENNTKLIETYSYYHFEGIFIDKLKELLLFNNIELKPLSSEKLFFYLDEIKRRYEFKEFIRIIKTFLRLFKSKNYSLTDLERFKKEASCNENTFMKNRETLFFDIFEPIYKYYESELKKHNSIDFDDMINMATSSVSKLNLNYKYIIIDEYQDISQSRYKLVKAIKDKTNASVMAVGDDWQAIYRFAGSDIKLFTDFEKHFGYSKILRIEKTYRNSQEIINRASKFVMKNPIQLRKSLKSDKVKENPITILGFHLDKESALSKGLARVLTENSSKSVLLLGRNNSDINFLEGSNYFYLENTSNGIIIKTPLYPNANIFFMTVHKSKGLEADEVIIINNSNSIVGFPNKIADDTLLRYVLVEKDEFDYGEERRLFYVALTRTRHECILLTPILETSCFIEELKKEGVPYIELEQVETINCPRCQTGNITIKNNGVTQKKFLACNNFPQCSFTSSKIEIIKKPIECSRCGGYLVKRNGPNGEFLGCINFPHCNNTENIGYIQTIEEKRICTIIDDGGIVKANHTIEAGW